MRNLYSLKHKFLVLVSALVIYGLVPTMLSGHSTGAWMATSACGKQAFIFVSAWHPVGGITPAEGLYIDRNQNGMIIQSGGINKSVCNTPTGEYTGTTGVANSTDYFPMSTWISSTTANLPNNIFRVINTQFTSTHAGHIPRLNGSTYDVSNTFANDPGVFTKAAQSFGVGAYNTGSAPCHCDIAELIYFTKLLTASERQAVERYLAQKWNIIT